MEDEVAASRKVGSHPNILKFVDYYPISFIKKPNGKIKDVICVIVEELAESGELFDFVSNSGYFNEQHARYFFK